MVAVTCYPKAPIVRMATLGRRPVPVWRRRYWQAWRDDYIHGTRPGERTAWVSFPASDSGKRAYRLATVQDLRIGGLELLVSEPYEPGTLLQVEVWDNAEEAAAPLPVRVMKAEPRPRGEWLLRCCFARRAV